MQSLASIQRGLEQALAMKDFDTEYETEAFRDGWMLARNLNPATALETGKDGILAASCLLFGCAGLSLDEIKTIISKHCVGKEAFDPSLKGECDILKFEHDIQKARSDNLQAELEQAETELNHADGIIDRAEARAEKAEAATAHYLDTLNLYLDTLVQRDAEIEVMRSLLGQLNH
jgi:DNA-binding transcriptional MerR regulator